MSDRAVGSNYYDLKVQQQELQHQLECLNSEASSRQKDHEKLCLFYEKELEQWLNKMDKQKAIWAKKRKKLSQKCGNLQESIRGTYSTNAKLNQEKEKYCNVMSKLMPEWQKAIERKQMKEISEFENRVSMIQQRRHSADIAFEKEKKLLSLISIRQKQIQKLEDEEKQEAVIREQQRSAILQQENDYNDKLRLSKSQTFADVRLQEYIIRKSVTSDMEKKYSDQINELKTRLSQTKLSDFDALRSTLSYSQRPKTFDDAYFNEEEEEEIKDDNDKNVDDSNVKKNMEGDETVPITEDMDISNKVECQNENVSISADLNTLHFMNDIKQSVEQIQSDVASDTSKIEQAIGMIEVNHHKNEAIESSIPQCPYQESEKKIEHKQDYDVIYEPSKEKIQILPQRENINEVRPISEKKIIKEIEPMNEMLSMPIREEIVKPKTEPLHDPKQGINPIQMTQIMPRKEAITEVQHIPRQEIIKEIEPIKKMHSMSIERKRVKPKVKLLSDPKKEVHSEEMDRKIDEPSRKQTQAVIEEENVIQSDVQKQKEMQPIEPKVEETVKIEKPQIKKKTPPKSKTKSNSKLKRSFRARTSKNRLQFSVLGMVSPKKDNAVYKPQMPARKVEYTQKPDKQPNKSVEEVKVPTPKQDIPPIEDESSEDGFDDLF